MILVTGATGHVGNVLVRMLLEQGMGPIRILLLPGEDASSDFPLRGLPVERVYGDVRSAGEVLSAVRGCDTVIHLAGIIDISRGKTDLLYQVNVEGTQNVVNACLCAGVRRLVYTSSVHALPVPPPGETLREGKEFPYEHLVGHYARSKSAATAMVQQGVARGLDAVIVFPSGIIGPEDYRLSELGRTLRYAFRRKRRRFMLGFAGSYNFVDVRDVAQGILLAMEKGKTGEGYLLSGHALSVSELFRTAQAFAGCKPKILSLPAWMIRLAAGPSEFFARIFGKKALLTPYSVDVLLSNSEMSAEKAQRELGYQPRPMESTLSDTLQWLRQYEAACKAQAEQEAAGRRAEKLRLREARAALTSAQKKTFKAQQAAQRAARAAEKAGLLAQNASELARDAAREAAFAQARADELAALLPARPAKVCRRKRRAMAQ